MAQEAGKHVIIGSLDYRCCRLILDTRECVMVRHVKRATVGVCLIVVMGYHVQLYNHHMMRYFCCDYVLAQNVIQIEL